MPESWISSLVARHARSGVLPDSNLLFLFLVGTLDPTLVGQIKGTREYTNQDFRLVQQFIARFRQVFTTPNILTEVSNLVCNLREDHRRRLHELIRKSLEVIEERYVATFAATSHATYERLGVSDAVVGSLADEGLLVFTNDLDLALMLESRSVPCVHYTRVFRPLALGLDV